MRFLLFIEGVLVQLLMLRDKTLEDVAKQLTVWRPNLVYFSSGASPVTEAGHRTLMHLSFKAADGEQACTERNRLHRIIRFFHNGVCSHVQP